MKNYIVFLVAFIWCLAYFVYLYKIIEGVIAPTLSTRIMFSTATCLSAASYLKASDMKWKEGVIIITDALLCIVVMVSVVLFTYSGISFKPFEKYYLIAAGVIVAFLAFTSNAFVANLLVQALIVTGYFPTIQNLAHAVENPESPLVWGLSLTAATISLYTVRGNVLATIYSVRAIVMILIVLILMLRL